MGLHALGAFADRLGLGDSLSARIAVTGERLPLHDRGKVPAQTMLMLAAGGESCADIEHLRSQDALFGDCRRTPPSTARSAASTRPPSRVCGRPRAGCGHRCGGGHHRTGPVVLDIDPVARAGALGEQGGHRSGPQGRLRVPPHALFRGCHRRGTGRTAAARQRRGQHHRRPRGGARRGRSHSSPPVAVGHRPGDDPELVGRAVRVRTDSAGCTEFVHHCRARNVGFAVVARSNATVHAAISRALADEGRWPRR